MGLRDDSEKNNDLGNARVNPLLGIGIGTSPEIKDQGSAGVLFVSVVSIMVT